MIYKSSAGLHHQGGGVCAFKFLSKFFLALFKTRLQAVQPFHKQLLIQTNYVKYVGRHVLTKTCYDCRYKLLLYQNHIHLHTK